MAKADRFTVRDAPGGRAYQITCSGCGDKAQLSPNNAAGVLPPQIVQRKFMQRGWEVGATPRKDVCPACQRKEADVPKIAKIDKNLRVVELRPAQEPQVAAVHPSREDRRIILSKLHEAYQDEATGYRPGWSDKRVAADLGVREDWVQELRQENFGDLAVSALDDQIRAEAKKIREELEELELQAQITLTQLTERMQELARQRQALEQKLTAITTQAA